MELPRRQPPRPLLPLFVLVLGLALVAFVILPPGLVLHREVALEGPFEHAGSRFAFEAEVPRELPQDHNGTIVNSRAVVLEDGKELGPAHAGVARVDEVGSGAFAHLREGLWFSTSDGSDPNSNGRSYALRVPAALPVLPHLLVVVLLQVLLAFAASRWLAGLEPGSRWRRLGPWVQLALALGALQLACYVLVEHELVESGRLDEQLYRQAFGDPRLAELPPPEFRFVPHHYLNYALNPEQYRGGVLQHDPVYRIRRTEPLRPRREVKLRILALGGSTTYDNALLREEDTWVYRLESKLRADYGPGVEVINGGVGGYTLYENFIHYVTLLTYLQPDVVLIFSGINDVNPRMFGDLAPDYSNYRRPWRRGTNDLLPSPVPWLAPFFPYRYYYLRAVVLPARQRSIGRETQYEYPWPDTWQASLERNGPQLYGEILDNLVLLLRAQGHRVVILPQYFTPRRGRDQTFAVGVNEHNEIDRQVAERYGLPFGAALLEPDTFSPADTVDNCHFSTSGAARMAELVYDLLRSSGTLDDALAAGPGAPASIPSPPPP